MRTYAIYDTVYPTVVVRAKSGEEAAEMWLRAAAGSYEHEVDTDVVLQGRRCIVIAEVEAVAEDESVPPCDRPGYVVTDRERSYGPRSY